MAHRNDNKAIGRVSHFLHEMDKKIELGIIMDI